MPKAKQLSVSVENRPGMLARVARVLGDAKVNILAFLTTTSNAEGAVHVVVDNVNKARSALDREKLSFTEADVLHIELPQQARGACELCREARGKRDQHYSRLPDECEGLEESKRRACGF